MIQEPITAKGELLIQLFDEHGNIKEEVEINNLVVNLGLAYIASRMKDATATVMSHMAVGTSSTAASGAQTGLVAEAARVALSSTTLTTTTVTNDAVLYAATFGAGVGTGALTEAGLLNASSAGTMLSRTVFSVINKGALDTLTVTWKITIQ